MTKREDTIETIERVLKLARKNSICVSIPKLIAEWAVSMLKEQEPRVIEQEPRVMTLEEVKRLLPGADVWIEYHDLTGWKIAAITVREIFDNGLLGELQSLRYGFDRYGCYNGDWLAWRCWSSRPTNEQREAVKWDEK